MKLTNLGPNLTQVQINGTTMLYSYGTPVAANTDGKFYRTEMFLSTTTSKHINKWLAGAKAIEQPQEWFNTLVP